MLLGWLGSGSVGSALGRKHHVVRAARLAGRDLGPKWTGRGRDTAPARSGIDYGPQYQPSQRFRHPGAYFKRKQTAAALRGHDSDSLEGVKPAKRHYWHRVALPRLTDHIPFRTGWVTALQSAGDSHPGAAGRRSAGTIVFFGIAQKFLGTKGIWRRLRRGTEGRGRHVRGFAGRFRDVLPRALRLAERVCLGITSRFSDLAASPLVFPAPKPAQWSAMVAAGNVSRTSQSPGLGALYADC